MARKPTRSSPDEDAKKRFAQRKMWFSMAMAQHEANRYQMALDEDYYDSLQWTAEEAAAVRRRGQNPIVYNEVKPTIDWMIGTERRMRRDFKVLNRNNGDEAAAADAGIKTDLLKYLSDVNREPFERSQAVDDCWKAGMGWIEVGVRSDPEDEPIYTIAESWRNIVYDPLATRQDLSDARFLFRFREVDLDIAQAYFPDKQLELARASSMGDGTMFQSGWLSGWPTDGFMGTAAMPAKWMHYDSNAWLHNPRKRVLLIECWNYEPFTGSTKQGAGVHDRARMRMRVSIMTEHDTLIEEWSPYKHNRYPFVPLWAYRRKKDRMPYGPVRPVRGPQDDLNKRFSKANFLLNVNQLRLETGAIDEEVMDTEEIRDEMNDPNGIVKFANGALSGNKVQVREHGDMAAGHLAVADRNIAAIRSTGGVNEENRGLQSNATSRVAMDAKADRGSVQTAELFDNLLFAHQLEGELKLSLIEQYYTEKKVFSVTGERYKLDYKVINDIDPATGAKINDVTAHQAQFVIGDAPWRQSMASASFDSAMNMLAQLAPMAPQVVTSILDLVFEWSDMPNKQSILQRIRQATGMSDPDADSPQDRAAQAQKAQLAEQQMQLQLRETQAVIREAEAKGAKVEAEAMAKRLETLYMAAQAAQVLMTAPGAAPVADELAKSVGFEDQNGGAPRVIDAPVPQVPAQTPMPELQQADDGMQGIETPAPDGVIEQPTGEGQP